MPTLTRSARRRSLKSEPPPSSARKGRKAKPNKPFSLVDHDENHMRNSSQNSENLKITEIGDSVLLLWLLILTNSMHIVFQDHH
jgi:hypothetical protein